MALRDLMNNYFYGKQGKGDFTLADLPKNRRELFGVVLKTRWSQMVGLNLIYLIIWIPAIVWTGMNLGMLNALANSGPEMAANAPRVVTAWLLLLAPCVAITGPCNAGATYVLRNWARDQHSFLWSDFKDALKANWKQALAVSCISGLMLPVVYVSTRFYLGQLSKSPVFLLPMALVMLLGLVWSLAEMLMYPLLITYDLKLKDVIRNAVLLTIGKLPFAVLFKLITLIVPILAVLALWFIPGSVATVSLVVSALYVAFMLAFNKLVTVSYANWLCETYLNPQIEGAQTNIGLRPENWDDVEYRPEDDDDQA